MCIGLSQLDVSLPAEEEARLSFRHTHGGLLPAALLRSLEWPPLLPAALPAGMSAVRRTAGGEAAERAGVRAYVRVSRRLSSSTAADN